MSTRFPRLCIASCLFVLLGVGALAHSSSSGLRELDRGVMAAAVGGCSEFTFPCHYASACADNSFVMPGSNPPVTFASTYYYYKHTSPSLYVSAGSIGSCAVLSHYNSTGCVNFRERYYYNLCN